MSPPPPRRKSRGLGRPKGSSGELTAARIIEAARTCFGARGFGATTNKEIGAAAQVTAAAIYRYFPSKLALFEAVMRDAMEELERALRAATVGCQGGRDELVALMEAAAALHEERPYLAAFLSSLPVEMRRHPEVASLLAVEPDAVSRLLAEAVSRAAARGELAEGVDEDGVLAMVMACNIGLSLWVSAIEPGGSSGPTRSFARLLGGRLFKG